MLKRLIPQKAVVGFVILAVGCGLGINTAFEALHDSKERGEIARGIICNILTQSDEQGLQQIPATAKILHISVPALERFEKGNLERTEHYRAQLAPSLPPKACLHGVTALHIKKLP